MMLVSTILTTAQYLADSHYYVAMTYHWLGMSEEEAQALIIRLDKPSGFGTPSLEHLFHWGLVQPRILYSALSAPFVAVMGPRGMAVVPILAMAFLTFFGFAYLSRRYGVVPALVPIGLLTISTYMMSYGTAMLTEGLAAGLGMAVLGTLPLREARSRRVVILSGVLTVALAFTRQAWMLPFGGIVVAWFGAAIAGRRLRNRWLPFVIATGVAGIGSQLLQNHLFPGYSILSWFKGHHGADTMLDAIGMVPQIAMGILRHDATNFLAIDRGLFVLLFAAPVVGVVMWRSVEAHLYVGVILAGATTNILNGTPTNFLYEMPGLAFVLLVVAAGAAGLSRATHRWRERQASDSRVALA
ncbi:MAG: hypothetical protein KQH57_04250 [Actinomycetales bacterium]|nr:hypothetical protein [Actinomycetales bacterium]